MNSYKGFEYPTLRDFFTNEEEYTYSEDDTKWAYIMGGVRILIKKDCGDKEISEIFKKFIDNHYEQVKIVKSAVNDMGTDIRRRQEDQYNKFVDSKLEEKAKSLNIDIELLKEARDPNNTLTKEQIDKIVNTFNGVVEESEELKTIAELPSNNGVTEISKDEVTEQGEYKDMNVNVNPNTGEKRVVGSADDIDNESFEDMVKRINENGLDFETNETINEEDIEEYLNGEKPGYSSLLDSISNNKEYTISRESSKVIMDIVDRKLNKEKFAIYKELPEEVQKMIDDYVNINTDVRIPMSSLNIRTIRNNIAEALIEDLIANIQMDKIRTNFGKQIQDVFTKGSDELSEAIIGYSKDKIDQYRKTVEAIEDPQKKQKLEEVLDKIDDAYNLTSLKEFAKTCKIKKYDLEKPSKYYDRFVNKYENSNYDAYDIEMIKSILIRHLGEEYTNKEVDAFFIAFCKQTLNYNTENVLDHCYMYFITYNIALMDINTSENTKEVSDTFLYNIKEVISNLRERNKGVL